MTFHILLNLSLSLCIVPMYRANMPRVQEQPKRFYLERNSWCVITRKKWLTLQAPIKLYSCESYYQHLLYTVLSPVRFSCCIHHPWWVYDKRFPLGRTHLTYFPRGANNNIIEMLYTEWRQLTADNTRGGEGETTHYNIHYKNHICIQKYTFLAYKSY